jgi:hypothetical protein
MPLKPGASQIHACTADRLRPEEYRSRGPSFYSGPSGTVSAKSLLAVRVRVTADRVNQLRAEFPDNDEPAASGADHSLLLRTARPSTAGRPNCLR